jgi:glycosyltransferase involved in cell wall biosynthesis
MEKRKILFLGECQRADAITWMNGLKEFGDFEIITWELKTPNNTFGNRILRLIEFNTAILKIKKIIKAQKPDMVIAERTTSYGFLAALTGIKPIAIAQQGSTDLWPENSILLPLKKIIQNYAFKKATLIHAWGSVMTIAMKAANVDMQKVLILPKGINLETFESHTRLNQRKINAVVTRSLLPEYKHEIILKAFAILDQKEIDFFLTIVGNGKEINNLKSLAKKLQIGNKVNFTGKIKNTSLPKLLQAADFYISMPATEGVSASLFEAMATNCYPIVTDLPGNRSWIEHRKNGQLISLDDSEMLANELIWAFKNIEYRKKAILENRLFVEKNADYKINMKIISDKYHELINRQKNN